MTPSATITKTCEDCGKAYQTHPRGGAKRCPACRPAAQKRLFKSWLEKRKAEIFDETGSYKQKNCRKGEQTVQRAFVLEHDPADYPLAQGMTITSCEFEMMLRFGSFTPGTILRSKSGAEVIKIVSVGSQLFAKREAV